MNDRRKEQSAEEPTAIDRPAFDPTDVAPPAEKGTTGKTGKKDKPPKLKKSLPRRMVKWFFTTLGVLLILILLAVGFFHLPVGKNIARGIVESSLGKKYDGKVTLGKLDYTIFGDVDIGDLVIADNDGKPVVKLGALHLELDWGSLLSAPLTVENVTISGFELDDEAYADGTSKFKRMQKEPTTLPPKVVVQALGLSNSKIHIKQPDGSDLWVEGLTVAASVAKDDEAGTLDAVLNKLAAKVHIKRADGSDMWLDDVEVAAKVAMNTLKGELTADVSKLAANLHVVKGPNDIRLPIGMVLTAKKQGDKVDVALTPAPAEAVLKLGDNPEQRVPIKIGPLVITSDGQRAETHIDGISAGPLTIKRIVGAGAPPPAGKIAMGPGIHEIALQGLKLDAKALNTMLGREALISDVTADISVKGPAERLDVAGKVATDGGTFTLTGFLDLHDLLNPVWQVDLVGADIDTAKLLPNQANPLTTQVKVHAEGHGLAPAGVVKLHIEIGPTALGGKVIDMTLVDLALNGPLVTLEQLAITAYGQTITLDGSLDRATRLLDARLRASSKVQDTIARVNEAGFLLLPLPILEGLLDVDFKVTGKLTEYGAAIVAGTAKPPAAGEPLDPAKMPVEDIVLKGTFKGSGLRANFPGKSFGAKGIDASVDVAIKDMLPKGSIHAVLSGLDLGTQTIDTINFDAILDGLNQDVTLAIKDAAQKLEVLFHSKNVADLKAKKLDAVVDQLSIKRGAFEMGLDQPVHAVIEPTHIELPPAVIRLAGGLLKVGLDARFVPNPDHPGATLLDSITLDLGLEKVNLATLAAAAGKSTKGFGARLDASLEVRGSPFDPSVDFGATIHGQAPKGGPFQVAFNGQIRDSKLDTHFKVTEGRGAPLVKGAIQAPLLIPKTPEDKPGLAPGGRLVFDLEAPKESLARWGRIIPGGLPAGIDPNGTLAGKAHITGTPARPTGSWDLEIIGAFLKQRGVDAEQMLHLTGTLSPEGGKTALAGSLDVFLDRTQNSFVHQTFAGRFDRSPLLQHFMNAPWTFEGALAPIQLAALNALKLAPQAVAGTIQGGMAFAGKGLAVTGKIHGGFDDIVVGTAPASNGTFELAIGPEQTTLTQRVSVAGLEALRVDVVIGLPGKVLMAVLKDRPRLMQSTLAGHVVVTEHPFEAWHAALPKVPKLPGKVGGDITLGGTLATPEAHGAIGWDGFDSLAGTPGRVALLLDAGPERIDAALALGTGVRGTVHVQRADLKDKDALTLPVVFEGRADHVDFMTLVPAFVIAGKTLELKGFLDWHMDGKFLVSKNPDKPGLDPASTLSGDFGLSELDIVVPDTDRHFRDGKFHIVAEKDALVIDAIHFGESDLQNPARTLDITGRVALPGFKPGPITLAITSKDWLVMGLGFDGPEAELDIDLQITADVAGPAKKVDLVFKKLDVFAPERFVRYHYPQIAAYSDLLDVSDDLKPGKLPYTKPPVMAFPKDLALEARIAMPEPVRLGAYPLDIALQGALDVVIKDGALSLHGGFNAPSGLLNAMGRILTLAHGKISADGGLETFKADLRFVVPAHPIALRDVAMPKDDPESHHGLQAINVAFAMKTGLQTTFDGVGGPYVLDAVTVLNGGRSRLWSLPDTPASETVRFGNKDHGLVISYVQTNLRNLIFMDRQNGWSDSLENPLEYGRLRHFDMQRFVPAGRIRMRAEPLTTDAPGVDRTELSWDWLLLNDPRTVLGFGPHLGCDLRAGVGFQLEWSTQD